MCGQPTASDDDDERDNRAGSTMTKTSCKLNAKVGLVGHHDEKGKENCRLATEVDRVSPPAGLAQAPPSRRDRG